MHFQILLNSKLHPKLQKNRTIIIKSMEAELKSIIKVTTLTAISMAYARLASSITTPGKFRLLALLPVIALLPSLPWHFSTIHLRIVSFFFHVWLAIFKLLLLSVGSGPLSPSLPLLRFIAIASLPVKLRYQQPTKPINYFRFILHSVSKMLVLRFLMYLYRFKPQVPNFLLLAGYNVHTYLSVDLVLSSSAFAAGCFLGIDLDPQFHVPVLSGSLQEFWGRRWNLMATDILRPSVYEPVRALWGPHAGTVAAFAVSGVMHEVLFFYLGVGRPTGEALLYFVLQGVVTAAERKGKREGWWRPPAVVAAVVSLGFVMVTSWWLFLGPLVRSGVAERAVAESVAAMGFLVDGATAGLQWIWGFL